MVLRRRLVFNPKAIEVLGFTPAELAQRGYALDSDDPRRAIETAGSRPARLQHALTRKGPGRSLSETASSDGLWTPPARSANTKSRDRLYGTSVRIAAQRAAEARREADALACDAWTKRMLAFKGPAQPSPTLGDALNAGYTYLEVRCLGCDTHQSAALDIVRQGPKVIDMERR
jgi:hypothetical protein